MTLPPLRVLGIGLHLPPAVSVREHRARRGGDVSDYRGWERACHAGDDEHPSTMGRARLGRALEHGGVAPGELRLVVFTGASRDYVPSWSVATEVMRLSGLSDGCIGLDLTAGCLATLAALDLAHGWLAAHGGGARRSWPPNVGRRRSTPAIPRRRRCGPTATALGALVVGLDPSRPGIVDFLGAEFRSASANKATS